MKAVCPLMLDHPPGGLLADLADADLAPRSEGASVHSTSWYFSGSV